MADREKQAALFDAAAAAYDRFRPGYPEQLIDDMLRLASVTAASRLLEVGCGTGKLTVQIASRGNSIECVDPGANLLAVARKNCCAWPKVTFLHGKFEEVALPPNHYDLIYSAQAFHWVDQNLRWSLSKRYLVPSGALAIIHNYSPLPRQGPGAELTARLQQITAGAMQPTDHEASIRQWEQEMERTALFSELHVRRYGWTRPFTAEEYVGLFTTFSDFLSLTADQQEVVTATIREVITANGGILHHQYESVLFQGVLGQHEET